MTRSKSIALTPKVSHHHPNHEKSMQDQTDTDQPRPVAEAKRLGGGCLNRLVRAWRYCFIRRLAVCPKPADPNIYSKQWPQRMMFQWQKMPHNWRWF